MRSDAGAWAQRQYKTKRWQRVRARQLNRQRYCECPHHKGKRVPADTVDHKIPHRGDPKLFWDERNLQSMTKPCHDAHKQSQERGGAGFLKGCDERGWPLSKEHEWYSPNHR